MYVGAALRCPSWAALWKDARWECPKAMVGAWAHG